MPAFIIAEAGVNHNGDVRLAHRLVEVAAACGADAVKFQTFVAGEIAAADAGKCGYQLETTNASESQQTMLRRLELPFPVFGELKAHCSALGIQFLSTPFDLPSLHFLTDELGLDVLKLPSGEITNAPFLLAAARAGQRIILSTGMSVLGEIEEALAVLAWGLIRSDTPSCRADLAQALDQPGVRPLLARHVTLLHCTSQYPTPYGDVNLRAMDTLAAAFGMPVGLSDHTPGVAISIAAAARGATVIEKHFTLDRDMDGPDHRASLDPAELSDLVKGIRAVEIALGDGHKRPIGAEWENARVVRKSLVARRAIATGEVLTADNVTAKRPGTGTSPMLYWDVLGKISARAYAEDEGIEP